MKLMEMVPDNRMMRFILVVLFTVLFLLRVPDIVMRPQFWAEDGTKFFRYAACFGAKSLLMTHAGYYHLVPRLTALLAALFDPLYSPAIYCGIAVSMTALVLYLVLSARLSLPYKPLLALFIVISPIAPDVYANITNIQQYLAIGVVALVLMKPSSSRLVLFLEAFFVFVAGLTGPFVLLLLPVFALKAWQSWSDPDARRRMMVLTIAAVAAASLQAHALSVEGVPTRMADDNSIYLGWGKKIFLILAVIFTNIYFPFLYSVNYFFPATFTNLPLTPVAFLSALLLISTAAIFIFSVVRSEFKIEKVAIAYFGVIVLIAGLYRCRTSFFALLDPWAAPRYFFIPLIMFSWFLAIMLNEKPFKRAAVFLIVLMMLASLAEFRRDPLVDYHWPVWASKIGTDPEVKIPINPPGWFVEMNCSSLIEQYRSQE